MRMWMVPPEVLCSQHLRGEHVETHMLAGALLRGKSIAGYLKKGQLEPALIYDRHEVLAREMLRRGMNHRSPLLQTNASGFSTGYVDVLASLKELRRRCPACKILIDNQRRKARIKLCTSQQVFLGSRQKEAARLRKKAGRRTTTK